MIVSGLGQCTLDYVAVVDDYPQEDSKYEVPRWRIFGGGPVATALVALTRFGLQTRFMGIICDDPAGKVIREGLMREGVDIRYIVQRKGGTSQTAFILANRMKGTRTIVWSRPSVPPVTGKDIPLSFLEGASLLHLDGLMMEGAISAARMAREMGVPVMYDAGSVREATDELIKLCDFVVCSESFSNQYNEDGHVGTLKKLVLSGVKIACITLGAQGSLNALGGYTFHQPAYDVDVVDTTGAGDVFHAGYIYGLLQRWPIEKIVSFASAVAACKCTKPGGRIGIPTVEEAMKLMETVPLKAV